ncbi:MAG: hypothetical protein JOZ32_15660 [Bryobacterales bacterium]|nr:hypothetical protein [Bryobacterales bacterium]
MPGTRNPIFPRLLLAITIVPFAANSQPANSQPYIVEWSSQGSKIEKQLFPDQAKMKHEEQRRWELSEVHWDLPIRQIDPNERE